MPIDFATAQDLANEHIRKASQKCGIELALLPHETLTLDFGWVFFFTSAAYLSTGSIDDAIGGNAPVIVDAASGTLHETGTARSVDYYISALRRELNGE